MFFDDWTGLWRTLIVSVCAYAAVVALLRVTGKRTLSKMNAFDLVVTVALGSTLATILLSADVALAEGVLALALLILLQLGVTWTSARSRRVLQLVKAHPRMLLKDGRLLHAALKRECVAEPEILAAARSAGYGDLSQIAAVTLETDGTISVVGKDKAGNRSALANLAGSGPAKG